MPKVKWQKAVLILAVMTLCCLMFAGVAMAADYNIYGGENPAQPGQQTNVVKADHTYNYTIEATGLSIDLNLFCDQNILDTDVKKLSIGFPFAESDNLAQAVGKTVPVYVTVQGQPNPIYVPVVPEIVENAQDGYDYAYFTIERQAIPVGGKVTAFKIVGLTVKNPKQEKADYCVRIAHTGNCLDPSCANLNVVKTVGAICLTKNEESKCDIAGGKNTYRGYVKKTTDAPWDITSWPIVVAVLDQNGNLAKDPNQGDWVSTSCWDAQSYINPCSDAFIPIVITHPDANGYFEAQLTVPACIDGKSYHVVARTLEVKDESPDVAIEYFNQTDKWLVPAEAVEDIKGATDKCRNHLKRGLYEPASLDHSWLRSCALPLTITPGSPYTISQGSLGDQIDMSDLYYPVTISLLDKYGLVTKNSEPCTNVALDPLKVDLKAVVNQTGIEQMGGKFYAANTAVTALVPQVLTGASEIDHTFIDPGQSSVTVWFKPTVKGYINLKESTIICGTPKVAGQCDLEVNDPTGLLVSVTPKVYNQAGVMAGWVVKVPIHYAPNATLRVELLDPATRKPITWATWSEACIIQFENIGDKVSGDTFSHPDVVSGKSDIYVYTDRSAVGKSLVVKVVDVDRNVKGEAVVGPYVCPVELVRQLRADDWQILSTPKTLAGAGNLNFLMGANYTDALTYDNGDWNFVDTQKLDPLKAYYVKTKQGTGYYNANYIFDRARYPGEDIPPTRDLSSGWNLVGVAVPANIGGGPAPASVTIGAGGSLYFQGDFLYKMLGTVCNGCKKVYNPGGTPFFNTPGGVTVNKMANIAPFINADISQGTMPSWAADPMYVVLDGDGYWLYLTDPQTIAAEVGLELVDP